MAQLRGRQGVAAAVLAELARGSSRTVFVPKVVGLVSRASAALPAVLVDAAFRLSGGDKVTAQLDREQRAAYQARIENQE